MAKEKKLTLKQQRFADEYIIRQRILAAIALSKRYRDMDEYITNELVEECLVVIKSVDATSLQKYGAKTILNLKFGANKANELIEPFAVVKDRNDSLVSKWRKKVKDRDKRCQLCGSDNLLEVHHISHWADDPVNRINPENGVLLCSLCHASEHPEISNKMFGGAKHER